MAMSQREVLRRYQESERVRISEQAAREGGPREEEAEYVVKTWRVGSTWYAVVCGDVGTGEIELGGVVESHNLLGAVIGAWKAVP